MAEEEQQQAPAGWEAVPRKRKILVAVDESEESIVALTWALDNRIILPRSDAISDTAVLLHVQTQPQAFVGPTGPGFYITPEIVHAVAKHQENISKKVLLQAMKICDQRNVSARYSIIPCSTINLHFSSSQVKTERLVAIGDPGDAICEAVEKIHADYLVVGSHGYGAIKRAFLGSVSDYCAHNAKCPVVIVKKFA